ncbi:MAG: c-type cytochrome [Sphingopyxis sp.]
MGNNGRWTWAMMAGTAGALMAATLAACGGPAGDGGGNSAGAANAGAANAGAADAGAANAGQPGASVNSSLTAPAPGEGPALASLHGDAAAGAGVFNQCRACHSVEAGRNGIGPSLHGVVGRRAGAVAGYTYSPANVASGRTWTPDLLFAYLAAPGSVIPGTKMAYALRDPQARADVIAYLDSVK